MSALHAAMAGAAAGAARQRRWLEEIDKNFGSSTSRQEARVALDLILEAECGNVRIAITCFLLSIPALFVGAILGELVGGSLGSVIGSFVAMVLLFGLGSLADNCLYKRSARNQLQKFTTTHPQGELIVQKVRDILSNS